MNDKPVMGELLIKEGLLEREDLEQALNEQKLQGGRLGYHLIRLGFVNVERLSTFLKDSMGLIPYDLVGWVKDRTILDLIPPNLAQFYQVVPVEKRDDVLTVAIADLDNPRIIPALAELTGHKIDPVVCPRETVVQALEHFYGISKDQGVIRQNVGDHLFIVHRPQQQIRAIHWSALKPDSAATEWLRAILAEAIRTSCRVVVIRPMDDQVRIAFRTPEGMVDRFSLDVRKREEMDVLLKELARLEGGRRGSRMEGRVRLQVESRFLSLHVRALRTLQGNRYTLTLHDEKVFQGDWDILAAQFLIPERKTVEEAIRAPSGMLLLAGAPGLGMSSVYYALLTEIQSRVKQIVALEEYSLLPIPGVSQVEVSRHEDLTWPEQILMALKQEPGSLVIYPVRERRSMELALLAASRIPVLAVLHQPNAAAVLRWMMQNKFKSALKANVLHGIITVASVPLLCQSCRLPVEVPAPGHRTISLMTRQGCEKCLAWDTLPTEEVLEWFPVGSGLVPTLEGKFTPKDLQARLVEEGGVPLSHRLVQRAEAGHLDGAEIRDYLI